MNRPLKPPLLALRTGTTALALALALASLPGLTAEGAGRDPTVPPEAVRAAASAPASAPSSTPEATAETAHPGRHLMVVGGKPYLIERGWLRGVGDRWGDARIERITPDAVWLRDAAGLHRHPLHPGVLIRPASAMPAPKPTPESTR